MNYSKICSIIVASFMVAAVFAVPVSSFASAEPSADSEEPEFVNGTFGFEITDKDLDALSSVVIDILKSLVPEVPLFPVEGSADADAPSTEPEATEPPAPDAEPEVGLQEIIDILSKETISAEDVEMMLSELGLEADVTEAIFDTGFYIAGVLDVAQDAENASISVDAVVTTALDVSVKGTYADGITGKNVDFWFTNSLDLSAAVTGSIKMVIVEDLWTVSQASAQFAAEASLLLDSDLPFLEDAFVEDDVLLDGTTGPDGAVTDPDGSSAGSMPEFDPSVLTKLKIEISPSIFLSAESVAYGDDEGEINMCILGFNNLEKELRGVMDDLGIPTVDKDGDDIFEDLDSYICEVTDFEFPAFDLGVFSVLDLNNAEISLLLKAALVKALPDNKELLNELTANIDRIIAILLDDDGLRVSPELANKIGNKVTAVINDCKVDVSDAEYVVNFIKPESDSMTIVATQNVKHGNPLNLEDPAVKALMTAPEGTKFIGWAMVDIETELEDGVVEVEYDLDGVLMTSKVYAPMNLVPIYAKDITDLSQIIGAGDYLFDDFDDLEFEYSSLELGSNLTLALGSSNLIDDENLVAGVSWNFKGGMDTSNITTGTNLKTGLKVSSVTEGIANSNSLDLSNAMLLDFEHSGQLPANTSVTLDMGDRYAPGTNLQVWHVEAGNNLKLANASVTVGADSTVNIPLNHLSSYVITEGSPVDDVLEPEPINDNGGNNNTMLYIGIGVGVVVLLGVAIVLFRRNH